MKEIMRDMVLKFGRLRSFRRNRVERKEQPFDVRLKLQQGLQDTTRSLISCWLESRRRLGDCQPMIIAALLKRPH